MGAAELGTLVGGILGMLALAHLPYLAISRVFRDWLPWVAVGLSPPLMYSLGVWGHWGDGTSFRLGTVAYLLGAGLFVFIRTKTAHKDRAKAAALALGGIGAIYACFGVGLAMADARAAARVGCINAFQRDFASVRASYGPIADYCECVMADMIKPTCRDISLLWTNAATEKCSAEFGAEIAASEDAQRRLLGTKDRCVATHLGAAAAQMGAVFVEATSNQLANAIVAGQDFKDLPHPEADKLRYVRCFLARNAAACPTKTFLGLHGCLMAPFADGGGGKESEKAWAECATETGLSAQAQTAQ